MHELKSSNWVFPSALILLIATACGEAPFPGPEELDALRAMHSPPTKPQADPTNRLADHPGAAALGKKLFEDPSLSACGTVSCSSCHQAPGYASPGATSEGCGGAQTARNAPTILNAGYLTWFMWDGRADRLWSQAILPLTNPVEMAATPEHLRERLQADYAGDFAELVGQTPAAATDGQLLASFGKIIAAYERTLNRTRSTFDDDVVRFIAAAERGEAESDPAYLGLKTFMRKGQCISCHKGPMLTDSDFHNVGLADSSDGAVGATAGIGAMLSQDWEFSAAGPHSDEPTGTAVNRLANLRRELSEDPVKFEGAFRTPTLRNLKMTAPYMHTGGLASLEEVVEFYDRGGDEEGTFPGVRADTVQPIGMTAEEKQALTALLESLSD